MMPNGPAISISFSATKVDVSSIAFNSSCVPTAYDMTLNGMAALLGPSGGAQNVTFAQLVMHVDSSGSATIVTVNGGMQSACFGGTATLTTQTALSVPSGGICPTAGVVLATTAGGQAQITFQSDVSVIIQSSGSAPLTALNCLDAQLLMCAA